MTQKIGNACPARVSAVMGFVGTEPHESAGVLTGFSTAIGFASAPADPRLATTDGEKLHGQVHACRHCGGFFWKGE